MKKAILIVLGLLAFGGVVWASVGFQSSGTDIGGAAVVNCSTGMTCTTDGSTVTMIATGTSATPTITGGTINGATIGATTPSTGKFSTLAVTTSVNWTDVTAILKGANFGGAGGINWTDAHYMCVSDAGVVSAGASCP